MSTLAILLLFALLGLAGCVQLSGGDKQLHLYAEVNASSLRFSFCGPVESVKQIRLQHIGQFAQVFPAPEINERGCIAGRQAVESVDMEKCQVDLLDADGLVLHTLVEQ